MYPRAFYSCLGLLGALFENFDPFLWTLPLCACSCAQASHNPCRADPEWGGISWLSHRDSRFQPATPCYFLLSFWWFHSTQLAEVEGMPAHIPWILLGRSDSKYQPLEDLTRICANNLWYISCRRLDKVVVALCLLGNASALINPDCGLCQDRWSLGAVEYLGWSVFRPSL